MNVAQSAVLGNSLLLSNRPGGSQALLDAILGEGGSSTHEHDGRLVPEHLGMELGEKFVLLERAGRFHLAWGYKEGEDSRLASQRGRNVIVLVCVYFYILRL